MEHSVGKILLAGLGTTIGGVVVKHIAREIKDWNEECSQKQMEERYKVLIRMREQSLESLDDCYYDDISEEETI